MRDFWLPPSLCLTPEQQKSLSPGCKSFSPPNAPCWFRLQADKVSVMWSVRKGWDSEQWDSVICLVCWLLDSRGPASALLLYVGTTLGMCICCVAFRCVSNSMEVTGGESLRCEYSHTPSVDTEQKGQVVSLYSRWQQHRLTLDSRFALFWPFRSRGTPNHFKGGNKEQENRERERKKEKTAWMN